MKPVRLAGATRQHQRIRELTDELEWERRKGVIAALLPYSGDRARPPRFPPLPAGVIPRPRKALPSERRLVEAARLAHHPHLRTDIQNNRTGR